MKEKEERPKFKKITKDEFLYEVNQLFQTWSRVETEARNSLNEAGGVVDSINDMLQFVGASEGQGIRMVFLKDEEGNLKIDTLPKRAWKGLLKS